MTLDITIQELRLDLSRIGFVFGDGTIQRFLIRHDMNAQKRLAT